MAKEDSPDNKVFKILSKKFGATRAWLIMLLIPALITGIITFVVSDFSSKRREEDLYHRIINQTNQNLSQQTSTFSAKLDSLSESVSQVNSKIELNIGTNSDQKIAQIPKEEIKGKSTEFKESEWIITNLQMSQGYYCNNGMSGYKLWGIWSSEKYSPNHSFKVRLNIKQLSDTSDSPILSWAYGDYSNTSLGPKGEYRINFFEKDENNNFWVRLYPADSNKSIAQQKFPSTPNFNADIELNIVNSIIAENSNRIVIGGTIKYLEVDSLKEAYFNLDDDFSTRLATIGLNGVKKQIGMAINRNYCIKPIFFEHLN